MSEKLNLDAAQQGVRQATEAWEKLAETWGESRQPALMVECSLRGLGEMMAEASKTVAELNPRLALFEMCLN